MTENRKVYIFDNEHNAEVITKIAYIFELGAIRLGSAVIMRPADYDTIIDLTGDCPAALVAVEDDAPAAECPDCQRNYEQTARLANFAWDVVRAEPTAQTLAILAKRADLLIREIDAENG